MPFFASVEVYLRKSKLGVFRGVGGRPVGLWVHFKVEKNKVAPPLVEGDFLIQYSRGVNRWAGLLEALEADGRITVSRTTEGELGGQEFTCTKTGEVMPLTSFAKWANANGGQL